MLNLLFFVIACARAQKLLQIQVLIRHGARTQIYGQYNPQNITQEDMGKLTGVGFEKKVQLGIRQHYVLGKALRTEYIDKFQLFGQEDLANFNQVNLQTTNYNRTIMSAHSLIYGMTHQNNSAKINESVLHLAVPPIPDFLKFVPDQSIYSLPQGYWPIPILTTLQKFDTTLLGYESKACPYCQTIIDLNEQSEDMKNLNSQWTVFFQHLRTKNLNVTNITQGGIIADDIRCNQVNGDPIPDLSEQDLQGLDYVRNLYYQASNYRLYEQVKFQATPFIQKILANMAIGSLKFQLFSAHDNNIFLLLNLLNLTNWKCVNKYAQNKLSIFNSSQEDNDLICPVTKYPEFASNAIIELWSKTNESNKEDQLYVKFCYNGVYYPICQEQTQECPYLSFKQQMEGLIDDDYDQICGTEKFRLLNSLDSTQSGYNPPVWVIIYLVIVMFLSTILSSLVGVLYWRRAFYLKKNDDHKIQIEELQL